MKIALAQFNPTVGDFEGNSKRILELAHDAKRAAPTSPSSPSFACAAIRRRIWSSAPPSSSAISRNSSASPRPFRCPSLVGYVGDAMDNTGKPVANSAALIAGGKILFEQRKMLLPTYDVFDESRYFQPAHTQFTFPFQGEDLGITICEDFWNDKNFWAKRLYERDPVAELVGKGSTLILNISASPYTIDKRALRHDMLQPSPASTTVPVVYVNQVGGNDSLIFDGSSVAFMPDGRVAAQRKSFEEDLVLFDSVTGAGDIRPPDRRRTRSRLRRAGPRHARLRPQMRVPQSGRRPQRRHRFRRRRRHRRRSARATKTSLGVAMPGPYSSEGSLRDAKRLAENLGIDFLILPISDVFASYRADPRAARLPACPRTPPKKIFRRASAAIS